MAIDILYDIAGSILYAVGIYTFALNANFAPGGISGLSLMINHFTRLPVGAVSLILNIPVIIVSYRFLGKLFLLCSLKTMVISALFMDLAFPNFPIYRGNPLLAALFCGIFSGAGLALIFMRNSSTGGTDFLILTLKKLYPHLSIGQISLVCDAAVILLGGLVFRNVDAVLYGIVATAACTIAIDKIMYGIGAGKLAIIITDYGMELARKIDEDTGRGSTLIKAIGTYSMGEKQVIICACSKSQVIKVRNAAHKIDPSALIIITESNEVFGEGFKPPELDAIQYAPSNKSG